MCKWITHKKSASYYYSLDRGILFQVSAKSVMFVWLNRCPQVAGICLEKISDFNSFSGLYWHLPRPPTPLLKINYPKKTACFCVMFVWLSLCPHVAGNCLERGHISKFSSDSGGKPPRPPFEIFLNCLPRKCVFLFMCVNSTPLLAPPPPAFLVIPHLPSPPSLPFHGLQMSSCTTASVLTNCETAVPGLGAVRRAW